MGLLDVFLQAFVIGAVACLVVDRDRIRARVRAAATGPRHRVPPGPARVADRRRIPVRLRLRGQVERHLLPGLLRRPLAVLGPRGLARGGRPAARPGRRCAAACPAPPGRSARSRCSPTSARSPAGSSPRAGQGRHWADQHPDTAFPFVPGPLRSLWHMHGEWLTFHDHLSTPAPVGVRPVVVAGRRPADPAVEPAAPHERRRRAGGPLHPHGGDADPLVAVRAGAAVGALAGGRPPRPGRGLVVAVAIAAGWLTWFTNLERTMFIFYMAPAVPVLRPRHHARPAGRARPAGPAWPAAPAADRPGRGGAVRRGRRRRRSSSSTRCSPGSSCPIPDWSCGSGSPPGTDVTCAAWRHYIVGLLQLTVCSPRPPRSPSDLDALCSQSSGALAVTRSSCQPDRRRDPHPPPSQRAGPADRAGHRRGGQPADDERAGLPAGRPGPDEPRRRSQDARAAAPHADPGRRRAARPAPRPPGPIAWPAHWRALPPTDATGSPQRSPRSPTWPTRCAGPPHPAEVTR